MQENEVGTLTHTKTIKLIEESIGVDLYDFVLGKGFSDMTPKTKVKKQVNGTSSKLKNKQTKTFVLQRMPSRE